MSPQSVGGIGRREFRVGAGRTEFVAQHAQPLFPASGEPEGRTSAGELERHGAAKPTRRSGDVYDPTGEPHTTRPFAGLLRRPYRKCPTGLAHFPQPFLGKPSNGRHHGKVAIRSTPLSSDLMRTLLPASLCWLTVAAVAQAQVKVPKPPDVYDATVRYRIQADRNERVLQYEAMTKFFGGLGFKEVENEDSDLGPFDPTAEVIAGSIPSKSAHELLNDRRVQTIILAPAGYKPPAEPQAPIRVLIRLSASRDQLALWNQTQIALDRLGFRGDIGYDARRFTVLRGTVPSANVPRLLRDLRYQPSGWFAPEQAPELFAKLPDGTPTPFLIRPFADLLPVRVVEVFGPAEAAVAVVTLPPIPADQPHLNNWTADLRRRLAEEGAATKPLRLEVVLAIAPREGDLEWRGPLARVGAVVEGRVGNVVTVLVPQGSKAADIAALADVTSVRLPRVASSAAAEAPGAKPEVPKKEEAKEKQVRYEADPVPAPAPKGADALKLTSLDRLHSAGKTGQGIRIVVIDTDFAGWEQHLAPPGNGNKAGGVAFIALTAERNHDVQPDPMPGTLGHGTQCAQAVRLAAPGSDIFLVRVAADAPYQVINVARSVRGDEFRTEGIITRRQEIEAEGNAIDNRRREARSEYQRAFEDFSDDEKARRRRIAAQQALRTLDVEERGLFNRQLRLEDLERNLARVSGAQIVVSELQWNSGFALDGASPVSRYLDDWLTRPKGGYTRHLTRPNPGDRPFWFQPAGDTRGQTWTGLFRDVDRNGVMEFVPPDVELKPGRWSRELNFLATRADGKEVLDLVAGSKVRVSVQWREPHDPSLSEFDYRVPVAPLRLQLVKQRDHTGEKYASDEIDVVAASEGLPSRLQIEPQFGVYEHTLEITLPVDGRYAVRLEGRVPGSLRPYTFPTLAGQEVTWELRPRVFVESADGRGRFGLADYSSPSGGVAVPADARSVFAIGAAGADGMPAPDSAFGAGPQTELHKKPDLLAPAPFAGDEARRSDLAAAFAAGWAASVRSAGVQPGSFLQMLRVPPGGLIGVPADWFRK